MGLPSTPAGSGPRTPWLNLWLALVLAGLGNLLLWGRVAADAGAAAPGVLLLMILVLAWVLQLLLQLVSWAPTARGLGLGLALLTGVVSYVGSAFGLPIDPSMLRNVVETDVAEALELVTWAGARHVLLVATLPAALLLLRRARATSWRRELTLRTGLLGAHLVLIVLAYAAVGGQASLYLREHRSLRWELAPTAPLLAAYDLAKDALAAPDGPTRPIGRDAVQQRAGAGDARRLVVVLVLGETATAGHFGLNGYARDTTPELALRSPISFTEVQACGTSTAESVPCLFSALAREDYTRARADSQENLLDVLQWAGVSVLWRENNSGCKGVCDRVPTERVAELDVDPALRSADGVYDEALLTDLDACLDEQTGDVLLVLHQQGSHGPAYHLRSPPAFKDFLPECDRADVQNCPREQLVNAYDNTIRYTDHVLSLAIDRLAARAVDEQVLLLYVSDHGESLGEDGVYLHGYPYWLAPEEQTHVPLLLWFGPGSAEGLELDRALIEAGRHQPLSHDHLFHTLLGLFGVSTSVYDPALDALLPARGQ